MAGHRARRLAGARVHDVTCSVGAELAALRNTAAQVLGSDLDPVRLAMARNNVGGVDLCRADALVLSPVFPTRSHPGGKVLGPLRFRLLAARTRLPVIALGGMDARRASRLGTPAWAAIDAFLR